MLASDKYESWEVLISYCYGEANKVADTLASIEVTLNVKFALFESPPCEIRDVLFDNVGVGWSRMLGH